MVEEADAGVGAALPRPMEIHRQSDASRPGVADELGPSRTSTSTRHAEGGEHRLGLGARADRQPDASRRGVGAEAHAYAKTVELCRKPRRILHFEEEEIGRAHV